MERVIIARQSMSDLMLPPGAQIHRKKRREKRVVARGGPEVVHAEVCALIERGMR